MKRNVKRTVAPPPKTHEGATASRIGAEAQLRRSVMACMLWEDTFYESGESIADRINSLVPLVDGDKVAAMAVEARTRMKLRHAPLLVINAMLSKELAGTQHRMEVEETIVRCVQRADEMAELLSIYWGGTKRPLAAALKRGLARTFPKFDHYQLAKYKGERNEISARDAMFLVHPDVPNSDASGDGIVVTDMPAIERKKYRRGEVQRHETEHGTMWRKLAEKTLEPPETWEVELSKARSDEDKRAVWTRLLENRKLGALALLRNLRNMDKVGVDVGLVKTALENMRVERVLPFRFVTAARYAKAIEPELEKAMFRCLDGYERLPGRSVVLVDVSGSMDATISSKSEMMRCDAGAALAMLVKEVAEDSIVYTFSDSLMELPPRRGMALRDAIIHSQKHSGTYLGKSVQAVMDREQYDRLIVFSDEQSHDPVPAPKSGGRAYMVNLASYQNGVGYGAWTHIDGFSEAIIDYIRESERIEEKEVN